MMITKTNYDKQMAQYRQDLHQIPELGFAVHKTSAYIRRELSTLSCQVEPIVETGIIALFDFGQKETLMFRTDMDGLPIKEKTGLSFASVHEGCMHACGHDGHMAGMLGFAHAVDDALRNGRRFAYNVLLLFQPAEETIDGALRICETHILDHYNIKAVFGLHLWPTLPKGVIASRPGPMMARSTTIVVEFTGVSAHCGEPEKGRDALAAACAFVQESYAKKEQQVTDTCVLKFGKMESGSVRNAISAHTRLEGTMRTFHDETWDTLVSIMEATGRAAERAYGVKFTLDVSKSHPAVVNDAALYASLLDTLRSLPQYSELEKPVMIAEDFSFFEQIYPGIFFFLGTGSGIPLHSDHYDLDVSVLTRTVDLFSAILEGMDDRSSC